MRTRRNEIILWPDPLTTVTGSPLTPEEKEKAQRVGEKLKELVVKYPVHIEMSLPPLPPFSDRNGDSMTQECRDKMLAAMERWSDTFRQGKPVHEVRPFFQIVKNRRQDE